MPPNRTLITLDIHPEPTHGDLATYIRHSINHLWTTYWENLPQIVTKLADIRDVPLPSLVLSQPTLA